MTQKRFVKISAFVGTFLMLMIRQATPLPVAGLGSQTIDTTLEADGEVNAYYSGVEGLSGSSLQNSLYTIIKEATSLSYAETAYAMKISDRNWDLSPLSVGDHVLYDLSAAGSDDPYLNLLYGNYNDSSATAYRWSADHNTIWNKEHTWAKSHGNFLEEAPAGTDLHHLRASDQANNNGHNNFDFGNVSSVTSTFLDERGTASGLLGTSAKFSGDSVYEPRDEDKGDIARMIFYMATRYFVYLNTGSPKLEIIEGLSGSSAVTATALINGRMGILSDLLAWNEEDPVSLFEIRRNNLIDHNFQGNRNPYIDHPEWVDMVYDASYSGAGASLASGSSSAAGISKTYTSLTADTRFVTTAYEVNETFSAQGLLVMASYADGTSAPVDSWTTSINEGTVLSSTGTFSVTVSATLGAVTQTTSYDIGVYSEVPVLLSLSLNSEHAPTTFALGSAFSHEGLLITGVYNIGNKILASSACSFSTPNMYALGEQSVQVSYGGKSATYPIWITNENAVVSSGSVNAAPAYGFTSTNYATFASSSSSALSGKTIDSIAWAYTYVWKTGTAYFGSSSTKGAQIGSASNCATSFIMETLTSFKRNSFDEITQVVFEGSGATDSSISLSVYVGSSQMGTTQTLGVNSSGFNTYTFTTTAALNGKLKLVFSQPSTSKALNFHGLAVYTLATENGVTHRQQALAFGDYVLALPACTLSEEGVQTMIDEHAWLSSEAQSIFASLTQEGSGAKDRYDYILSLHPESTITGNGDFIQTDRPSGANASFWLIFVSLPFVMVGLGGLAWLIGKKRAVKKILPRY